jgi:hypothetical protein
MENYMKNRFTLFASLLLVNALFGNVFTNTVTEAEFNTAFADMEFYVEIRSGAAGGANSHEFELGTPPDVSYRGGTYNWVNNSENPFIIDLSDTGFLSVTVGSSTTPLGNQPGITEPFNELWVGLKLVTGDDRDELSIVNHQYDGLAIDNPTIQDGDVGAWYGFKLSEDQATTNIAEFTVSGDLIPNMAEGSALGGPEGWTYVLFGRYNPDLVTPASSLVITENIDKATFDDAFNNDRIWYAQLQPGGAGNTHPDNEFEFGGSGSATYLGNATITDGVNMPFVIEVNESGFLTVSFSDGFALPGDALGTLDPFNTIWIGLATDTLGAPETVQAINQIVDSNEPLLDLSVQGSQDLVGMSFYYENIANMGSVRVAGDIFPNALVVDEHYTYTVFATYDPTLVPSEPPAELKVTAFNYDNGAGTLTFTWDSSPAATYSINYTDDLSTTFSDVLNANIPSGGSSTFYGPVANPVPSAVQLFFKISENE